MRPLVPTVSIINLVTDTPIASTTLVTEMHDAIVLDKPGTLAVSVAAGTTVANTMLAGKEAGAYLEEFSFDGVTVDHRKTLDRPTVTVHSTGPTVSDEGDDLAVGLGQVGVDKLSLVKVTFDQALSGQTGTIALQPDSGNDTGLLSAGAIVSYLKGIYAVLPGNPTWAGRHRLAFTAVPHSAVKNLLVSVRLWADSVLRATSAFMDRLVGLTIGDGTLPGTRGHVVFDTSDAAINLGGVANSACIGFCSTTPHMSFKANANPSLQATEAPIGDTLVDTTDLSQIAAQIEGLGGKATNGLPAGATITDIIMLGVNMVGGGEPTPVIGRVGAIGDSLATGATATVDWRASLPVFGVFVNTQIGGAYYWPGDGAFYPMGACPGVRDLAYATKQQVIYASTAYGVRGHSDDPTDASPWIPIGGLKYRVEKVETSPDGSTLFAMVVNNQPGVDGIWMYPAPPGHDEADAPGWQRVINNPAVVDFTVLDATSLAFNLADQANVLVAVHGLGTAAPFYRSANVPQGETVVALSRGPLGSCYVITGAGSVGLYQYYGDNAAPLDLNGDRSLVDIDGQPVLVNNVRYIPAGAIDGNPCSLLAMTNRGLYFSANSSGRQWAPMNGMGGLADQNLTKVAIGAAKNILGRNTVEVLATTGPEVYLSRSLGVWWEPLVSRPLDLGVYFGQLAAKSTGAPFPDWGIGAVGTGSPLATGRVVPWPRGFSLPVGWQVCRRWSEEASIVFRIVNSNSRSPFFGILFKTVSEITSSFQVPQATASEALAMAMVRELYETGLAQETLTFTSYFSDADAALRTLRPSHQVLMTYQGTVLRREGSVLVATQYVDWVDAPFMVLGVTRRLLPDNPGVVECQLSLGKYLLSQLPTVDQFAANLLYGIKNERRWGTP